MNHVELTGTGPAFVSQGIREIEPFVEEIISKSVSEIQILAYVFTPSALPLIRLLEQAASRGVQITIVFNKLKEQNMEVVNAIAKVTAKYPRMRVVSFEDPNGGLLHAKVVVSDRKRAIVGSANFTMGGLVSNYELGVYLEGEVVWKLSNLIDSFADRIEARPS